MHWSTIENWSAGTLRSVITRLRMNGSKEETMGAVGDSQVLAYPSLEPLSGATNISGVTATARKFINNTRPEVVR